MAFETGTAANYLDLLDRLRLFVTGHTELVNAGQQWEVMRWTGGTELILKGPGLAGTDKIHVGLRAFANVDADYYNVGMRGYVGYLEAEPFNNQPGASSECYVHLWNDAIPYWIVANGRRIVLVAKISTVYQALYLGLFLPYAAPGQLPYPLIVGGSSSASTWRWSQVSPNHRHFADPGEHTLRFRNTDGQWLNFNNWAVSGSSEVQRHDRNLWPYGGRASTNFSRLQEQRTAPGGHYPLWPLILNTGNPANNVFGKLDGCFYVTGFGNAAENIVPVGGVDHLVVQNVYRTARFDYWALRLS